MVADLDVGIDFQRSFSARRPLLGLTILLIEDSRFCSDAVRLMCLKSGARLRRADCIASARRHLATYRPSVAMVDLGLPDGSGLDVIREISLLKPIPPVILATSGDDDGTVAASAIASGAKAFLPKPLKNLKQFQAQILALFPDRHLKDGGNVVHLMPNVTPDPLAKTEDLRHALALLEDIRDKDDGPTIAYCAQFLASVAQTDADADLKNIAAVLAGESAPESKLLTAIPGLKASLAQALTV